MATSKTTTKPADGDIRTRKINVLVVTASAGPRRRAGFSFGPVPVELTEEQLGQGDDAAKALEALRADPFLKLDMVERDVPIDDTAE